MTSWRSSSSGVLSHFFSSINCEGAAFARIGRVEGAGEKFDAFAQAFDDAEALVIHRALDHLDHVVDLAWRACARRRWRRRG